MTPWERRALVIASYTLGDAGRFFRRRNLADFSPLDQLARDWVASKLKPGEDWKIPL